MPEVGNGAISLPQASAPTALSSPETVTSAAPYADPDIWPSDIAEPSVAPPTASAPLPPNPPEAAPKAAAPASAAYTQVPPSVVPAPTAASELNLDQLWQQLLSHLNRPSRALLSEHGQLIAFRGREAQIGIRNSSLARLAQSKLTDVEAAFLKVFDRKVTVSLQIMTAEVVAAAIVEQPIVTAPPAPPLQPYPEPLPSYVPAQVAPAAPPPPIAVPELRPAVPQQSVAEAISTAAPAWETFDALTHAAKDFAQFFNGAMVNLEGTSEIEVAVPIALDEKLDGVEWDEP
jgi:DNA polymerase III subunit gamma/tau